VSSSSRFTWSSVIPQSIDEVFAWHARPGAFVRLNDPWRPVRVTQASDSIREGAQVSIALPVCGPISIPWHLRHTRYVQNSEFVDEQITGPLRSWKHTHRFIADSDTQTIMRDEIEYTLPRGCGVAEPFLQRELMRLFSHRHALLQSDLELHARWSKKPRKTIVIAGASGFVGRSLEAFLTTAGHTVIRLVRRAPRASAERFWDPEHNILDPQVFNGADVLINLCGENIAAKNWSADRKARILESRVASTELLASVVRELPKPLEVVICASATGFYGDTQDLEVDEQSVAGAGFLADVCRAWEGAAERFERVGTRVVRLRLGMVLHASGGALAKMLPAYLCGVGGPLGSGKQWISWISMQDLLGIVEHAIYCPQLIGAVNAVAPSACLQRDFARTLGAVIKRPTFLPTPAFVVRAVFGEMGQELLLSSSRVRPAALMASGYRFVLGDLSEALRFESGFAKK
jgi:uncharacterized protein (TIGR01777 family)